MDFGYFVLYMFKDVFSYFRRPPWSGNCCCKMRQAAMKTGWMFTWTIPDVSSVLTRAQVHVYFDVGFVYLMDNEQSLLFSK